MRLPLSLISAVVSVIVVAAGAASTTRLSKLPPEALLIVADTLPASRYTSSPGAATFTVPELAPAAMVMVAPLDSDTITGDCATLVSVAV